MNTAPTGRHRGSRRGGRGLGALLAALTLIAVSNASPASAVDGVDLVTSLDLAEGLPVADGPVLVIPGVNNNGATDATNVVVDVALPAGASVADLPPECATSPGGAACSFELISAGSGFGVALFLTFAAPGTYSITSTARADQSDVDGDSSARLDVVVVEENADLSGRSRSDRVVVGTQTSHRVFHDFANHGPTAAAGASISGTVSGATIVANSFAFVTNGGFEVAADRCTVAATTFACAPVTAGGTSPPQESFVFYDVILPTVPTVIVAAATITGRDDPDTSNNTSTVTIDVDEPTAEIYAQLVHEAPVASGVQFRVNTSIFNVGELAAQQLVAVIEVPADWTVAVGSPVPPGTACTVTASPRALRCTLASLAEFSAWEFDALLTTPPGVGSGTVTLTVTTTSPEVGTYPNTASAVIRYGPGGQTRELTITPDADLSDGDPVTVTGTGFVPNATIYFCQGIIPEGRPSGAQDCGTAIETVVADGAGGFTLPFTVERFLVVNDVGVVDCAQPGAACGIGAADFFVPGGSSVSAGVEFTPQAPVDDPFDARINGTVTDGEGDPVAGVRVWAFTRTDTWVGSLQTTTDASGSYILEAAEPGIAYQVVFIPTAGSDMVTTWYSGPGGPGAPSRAGAAVVRLSRAEPVADASIQLAPGAVLTGTVVDGNGNPIGGVLVRGYLPTDTWIGTYATVTAADGTYRFDLPPCRASSCCTCHPPVRGSCANGSTTRRCAARPRRSGFTAGQIVMPDVTLSPSP